MRVRDRDSSRGMTLLEAVIALTAIGIVFASAISVVVSSSRVQTEAMITMEVANQIENVTECFRFAEDEAVFLALLEELGFDSAGRLSADAYSIRVEVNRTTVEITARDAEGRTIMEQTYDKR